MELLQNLTESQYSYEEIEDIHNFYTIKHKTDPNSDLNFDRLEINNRLLKMGYCRLNEDDKEQYVKITDNVCEVVTTSQVKTAFINFVKELPVRHITTDGAEYDITSERVLRALFKNVHGYLNSIDRIIGAELPPFLQDERDAKYFTFRNCVVAITKHGVQTFDYKGITRLVWKSGIIDRDFEYTDSVGDFEIFIEHICKEDKNRKRQLMGILGYLMHNYFQTQRLAIYFTDARSTQSGAANGGTGKGIIGKALGQMLNRDKDAKQYIAIGGKDIDEHSDTRYSRADRTTRLIHIEDIHTRFDFTQLYNDITDGATIRQLHHDPYIQDLKIFVSSNHTIDITAGSTLRRLIIFELYNYYSYNKSPEQEFGKWFWGEDWTNNDWKQFYSFMVRCAAEYMKNGVERPEMINYQNRRIDEVFSTREDFRYWFEYYIIASEGGTRFEIPKVAARNEFVHQYPQYDRQEFANRFTKWCKEYLTLAGIEFVEVRGTVDMIILYPSELDKQKSYKRT